MLSLVAVPKDRGKKRWFQVEQVGRADRQLSLTCTVAAAK